jgi:hypothetical protein
MLELFRVGRGVRDARLVDVLGMDGPSPLGPD